MSLQTEQPDGNVVGATVPDPNTQAVPKPTECQPAEFFGAIDCSGLGEVQGMVFAGASGNPNDHLWNERDVPWGEWAASKVQGRKPAYITMASFDAGGVGRFKGRSKANARHVRGIWIDIEGSADKYARDPEGGYPNGKEALKAVADFVRTTGMQPTFLVSTGSGGLHLYYTLAEPITVVEWHAFALSMVKLAAAQGLKIDAQCTTDAARIMRAPGSIHQKTGELVRVFRWRLEPYPLEELGSLLGHTTGASISLGVGASSRKSTGINSDVLGGYPEFSYRAAAEKCGAMNLAAQHQGRDTLYPVWILAARAADLSIEGRGFAHEISSGYADYDEADTEKKLSSLTGGPAGCEAWVTAYGAGGPCDSCKHRGTITNPAIQLGRVVLTTPPGSEELTEPKPVADWVAEMRQRFATVRHGSKMVVIDFKTPSMTGRGVAYGFGFLDVGGFNLMLNGRFAPIQKAGERPRPLAAAYLAHPDRLQYAGLVFAPGMALPPDILNLWQGFAVEAAQGEVSLWLELLSALVPDDGERLYVLRWLAWKVQNPGGVPDTILIFKGAKGTGKNSLFDPLILLFGRHAMLADDPELIAGRFTWHLMTLAFAVLDEAVFVQDPRQADRIKSRVTAKTMHYEQKGMDPVQGVNRCAYVMLTNHEYVWQATNDERRAVVLEVGEALRGDLPFWERYHAWAAGPGPAALLHYLQQVDLTGFNPRQIPKGEALREQIEQTALRTPAAAWWHQCLTEGAIRWRDGVERVEHLNDDEITMIDRAHLRQSYEQSAAARGRAVSDWPAVARRLASWVGPQGLQKVRERTNTGRAWVDVFPPLSALRPAFSSATGVRILD